MQRIPLARMESKTCHEILCCQRVRFSNISIYASKWARHTISSLAGGGSNLRPIRLVQRPRSSQSTHGNEETSILLQRQNPKIHLPATWFRVKVRNLSTMVISPPSNVSPQALLQGAKSRSSKGLYTLQVPPMRLSAARSRNDLRYS